MQNLTDMQTGATAGEYELVGDSELGILKDVFRMLPSGVTVQDEQGRFLLMNDAAAAQLGLVPAGPSREPWCAMPMRSICPRAPCSWKSM